MAQTITPVQLLKLVGQLAGSVTLAAQTVGADLTFYLPNAVPNAAGQILSVASISGNSVTLTYVNPPTGGGGSGTVTSVSGSGLITGGPITGAGTLNVAKSGNTSTAATAAANLAAAVSGRVITADGSGNVQDGGTLLSALVTTTSLTTTLGSYALLASPALSGLPTAPTQTPGTSNTTLATTGYSDAATAALSAAVAHLTGAAFTGAVTITPSGTAVGLTITGDANSSFVALFQSHDTQGYLLMAADGTISTQADSTTTANAFTVQQPADAPALVTKLTAGVGTHNAFEAWGILAVSPSVAVDSTGQLVGASGAHLAEVSNTRGLYVGGSTAGAGHIWLWSPAGTTLVDVSDASIALTAPVISIPSTTHTVVNADVAGIVSFAGAATASVVYATPYTGVNAPIVVITPLFNPSGVFPHDFWVTNDGSTGNWTGFTANNSQSQTGDVNYVVMGRA